MSGTAASESAPSRSGTSGFQLDARLAADSVFVADGPLSQVRLMDDSRFPWIVLVPQVADVSEWIDLEGGQQRLLLAEINQLSQLLRVEPEVSKLNIGALGNIVRQLHVHLVGRHPGDAAWPGPVWGSGSAQRFAPDALQQRVAAWAQRLR
ncbi:HIT domain-containing protein [Xanthomonas hortorum]|uniref:HIT family protein n=1 Tax=Xanthomonas hortorum pv. pelargonii TaxID=453602 RepID=A0A6V7DRT8_9XANT|nr:HIT family protein [Xanthomonas hortorum]MCE4353461.1 HIT family protein [Xanthomonas hortorum pv. pelargonii]MCM5526463.1 HIT family protein [Xanthomonas hortorum pv. pelargonii]MCM5537837.1 HIT family protein [Xanthomonas hortorum pv. pelargonii]MCM5538735.1 HIT family protein [Xanthomonas hortorum pv. pelargonii]MCM5542959.1 HIT family protein [Xanthomonas hortorum pv. pelargonii]